MNGSFTGHISLDEQPVKEYKHKTIEPDTSDPRILVLKEYIAKVPDATLQNLKKALIHFSKSTEEEFAEIVKAADINKYNELYTQKHVVDNGVYTDFILSGSDIRDEELKFIEKYPLINGSNLYTLYKQHFPNSGRKERFIRDLRRQRNYGSTFPHTKIRHMKSSTNQPLASITHNTNQQLVVHTIKSLYNAGFTPDTLQHVKPVLNELLAQNSNKDEIALAIAYLKS